MKSLNIPTTIKEIEFSYLPVKNTADPENFTFRFYYSRNTELYSYTNFFRE